MTDQPGLVVMEVEGDDLRDLDNEAGGHRIQRVPPTEKRGRVHTSTVTVAVVSGQEWPLNGHKSSDMNDFRVEWFSGTGKGGQHRNKHQNSARVIHEPTGLKRECQGRSREANLREATEALRRDLERLERGRLAGEVNTLRSAQVGSGMRGDKRRTYRFQDDRVTDHVTGKTTRLADVMAGGFSRLW